MPRHADPYDYAKQASTDLIEAYQARLEWLDREKAGSTSQVLRAELEKAEGAMGAASHEIKDLLETYTLVMQHDQRTLTRSMADRDAIAQPLLQGSFSDRSETELRFALMQIEIVRVMDQSLTISDQLSAFAHLTFALICKSGELVLRTDNRAARSAFFDELQTGLADMVIAKTPLGDIGVVVLRAIEAAREAEAKRRQAANDHLIVLELFQESCFAWAAASRDYIERLQTKLASPDPA